MKISIEKKDSLCIKEILCEIIAALLVLLFSYTAISKLLDYKRFVFQMKLVPVQVVKDLSPFLGWLIPIAELGIVLLLLIKSLRKTGFILSTFILTSFSIYIILLLVFFGKGLPCTCGGVISKMPWHIHLVFNIFFLTLTVIATILYKNKTT